MALGLQSDIYTVFRRVYNEKQMDRNILGPTLLSKLNYCVLTSTNKYNIVFILKKTLLLRWDAGKVRYRSGGLGRFKSGLRICQRCNYKCNY